MAVWRGYLAAWWYRQWLMERAFDPSGAELYYLNAQFEASVAALVVAGIGVALLLRAQGGFAASCVPDPMSGDK